MDKDQKAHKLTFSRQRFSQTQAAVSAELVDENQYIKTNTLILHLQIEPQDLHQGCTTGRLSTTHLKKVLPRTEKILFPPVKLPAIYTEGD